MKKITRVVPETFPGSSSSIAEVDSPEALQVQIAAVEAEIPKGENIFAVVNGDKDILVPFTGTVEWIRSLNYSIVDDWRSWHVKGQVAGYTTVYTNNLTFTTVKDAGHTAPEYKPENCLMMLKRWILRMPL